MAGLSGRHAAIHGVRHIAGTTTLGSTEHETVPETVPETVVKPPLPSPQDQSEQGGAVEPQLSRLTSSARRTDSICAQSRAQAPNALSGIGLAMP